MTNDERFDLHKKMMDTVKNYEIEM